MRGNARTVEFKVDAYTARLIGRENVSKLEGAVLEIVKNAYDADAKVFCLYYSKMKECLYILDNGTGMKEEVLRTHWMTIGNSSKKNSYHSSGNRIQTGAKGIGRFALDRLSDHCQMLTISEEGGLEWEVNWQDFDGEKTLSEVTASIYDSDESLLDFVGLDQWMNADVAGMIKECGFEETGTVFCLTGLHDVWDDKTMENLRTGLCNLLPPDMVNDFRILFFDDTTAKDKAEIVSANLDSYDYKIEFQVAEDCLEIQIQRNEFEFGADEAKILSEAGFDQKEEAYFNGEIKEISFSFLRDLREENCIGAYRGVLFFNKIQQSQKDKKIFYYKDIRGRENLARQFGGIKLYRDKFRVRPYGVYGDHDFDWLELADRRNRSPAGLGHQKGNWRVGAEQLIGSVYISRENQNLEDAANRNGIQDGKGLEQLKKVLLFVIHEFERDRQFVGRKLAQYAKKQDELAEQIENLRRLAEEREKWEKEQEKKQETEQKKDSDKTMPEKTGVPPVNPGDVLHVLNSLEKKQEEELQEIRDEAKMLHTLATTGIITNKFMHEIRTLTNNIGQELDAAYEAIVYDNDLDLALHNIRQAIEIKKNFKSWFGITLESARKDKRMRKKHDMKEMLQTFIENWQHILSMNQIELIYNCEENISLRCYEIDIENIISNLISNSVASFERETDQILEEQKIVLSIRKEQEGFLIDYHDTGWGLIEKYKIRPELILEAFESSKKLPDDEGTGMGMWIVNGTVSEYNGFIDLSENVKTEKGFYIKIKMGGRNV